MRAVIFSFTKISDVSILPSTNIAKFLSEETGFPIVFDDCWDYAGNYDILFIVNGAYAFCQYMEVLAEVVQRAKRIIWIQNDYTIVPPKATSEGQSPFRKAFRTRADKGLPDIELWTTVKAATDGKKHHYINWNSLTYVQHRRRLSPTFRKDLFYYGSYRQNRVKTFDYFFVENAPYKIRVSSPSHKFSKVYPWLKIAPAIRKNFYKTLAGHGLGLYIEDRSSHIHFHSPANRFYEMLSAQLPMVFQPASIPNLREAGFEISPYVVTTPQDVLYALRHREELRECQRVQWCRGRDYRGDLTLRLKELLRKVGVK